MARDYDLLGIDDMGADDMVLGAKRQVTVAKGVKGPQWLGRMRSFAPGAPAISEKRVPFGLGSLTFGAATGTALSLTAQPQAAIRPERLVVDIARTGASATAAVTVTELKIGPRSQLPGGAAVPATMFGATVQDGILALDPCEPGITVQINVSVSAAPAGADVIVVACGFFARAVL